MPHQVHLRTLGRKTGHRLSMLRNLSVSVLRYERVKTTEAKAKEVRRLVDKVVRLGLDGSLPARRRALALTRDPLIVEKAFTDLKERFGARPSGYTRLSRLGHRVGDGAPMMLVELLEGAPAAAKAAPEATAEAAPQGGVRGIARRLRGRRADEKAEGIPEPEKATAKAKAEKPRAEKPKAEKPAAKKTVAKKVEAKKADTKKPAAAKRASGKSDADAKRASGKADADAKRAPGKSDADAKRAPGKRAPLMEQKASGAQKTESKSKKEKS